MSFPSPQKILVLALYALFALAAPAISAQEEPPAEEIEKIKAEDKKRQDERDGKVDAPILVELFTTSDCSACVFADRMLYDTMNEENVIALSCHIKDLSELKNISGNERGEGAKEYSGPMDECVFRQWSYRWGRQSSDVMLSIPTFIINGEEQVDGEDPTDYRKTLSTYHYARKNKAKDVFLQWKDTDTISVHLPQKDESEVISSASVWIIRYKDMAVEKIDKGINKGRVLRFSNIIQNIKHIGKWHGQTRMIDVDVEKPPGGKDRGGYVVVVQELMGEPLLAAGKLVDYPVAADKQPAAAP